MNYNRDNKGRFANTRLIIRAIVRVIKKTIITAVILGVVGYGSYWVYEIGEANNWGHSETKAAVQPIQQDLFNGMTFDEWLDSEIKKKEEDPEFKKKVYDEARKQVLQEHEKKIQEMQLKLEESGFTGVSVRTVKQFLAQHNPILVAYAEEITELPRWTEVIAIAGAETTFCQKGVGESKNNCGAIKQNDGKFKTYKNEFDSLKDISNLLQKDAYKDKTISQMNGIYCVDEENGGGACPGWEENIMKYVSDIQKIAMKF